MLRFYWYVSFKKMTIKFFPSLSSIGGEMLQVSMQFTRVVSIMSQFEKTELSAYVAAKCRRHKEKWFGGYILLVVKKKKRPATFKTFFFLASLEE